MAVDAGFDTYDLFASTAIIEGAGGMVTDWSGKSADVKVVGRRCCGRRFLLTCRGAGTPKLGLNLTRVDRESSSRFRLKVRDREVVE
ncbi:hypothetical protein HJB70_28270 [Rhizobium lentis]|nr:hypothetical protein [Rhizobium lentis]